MLKKLYLALTCLLLMLPPIANASQQVEEQTRNGLKETMMIHRLNMRKANLIRELQAMQLNIDSYSNIRKAKSKDSLGKSPTKTTPNAQKQYLSNFEQTQIKKRHHLEQKIHKIDMAILDQKGRIQQLRFNGCKHQ